MSTYIDAWPLRRGRISCSIKGRLLHRWCLRVGLLEGPHTAEEPQRYICYAFSLAQAANRCANALRCADGTLHNLFHLPEALASPVQHTFPSSQSLCESCLACGLHFRTPLVLLVPGFLLFSSQTIWLGLGERRIGGGLVCVWPTVVIIVRMHTFFLSGGLPVERGNLQRCSNRAFRRRKSLNDVRYRRLPSLPLARIRRVHGFE